MPPSTLVESLFLTGSFGSNTSDTKPVKVRSVSSGIQTSKRASEIMTLDPAVMTIRINVSRKKFGSRTRLLIVPPCLLLDIPDEVAACRTWKMKSEGFSCWSRPPRT